MSYEERMKLYKERYGSDNSQNRNGSKNYKGKKNYNNKNSNYKKGDYKKGDYKKNRYNNKPAAPQKKGLLAKIKAFFGGKK